MYNLSYFNKHATHNSLFSDSSVSW